jgi:hypothetical protein
LQILPLVGLHAFEIPLPIAIPLQDSGGGDVPSSGGKTQILDTIIVPAQQDGFEKVFLGERCWYAVRVAGGMLSNSLARQ